MSAINEAYLGLGANLGDPIQQLIDARQCAQNFAGSLDISCSYFYSSAPVGYADQPDFINCVLRVITTAPMRSFFSDLQHTEQQLGRVRDSRNQNAPRSIDIDLLLFGEQCASTHDLTVPHPRMTQRLFVLKPLAELLPNGAHPMLGNVQGLIQRGDFNDQKLFRLLL